VLSLRIGKATRHVSDYVGERGGMPASVTALEEAVDALAGTERWTRGNAETVALLKAQGFDFASREAADLVQMAIWLDLLQPHTSSLNAMIRAALAAGLDLTLPIGDMQSGSATKTIPLGTAILRRAVETGDRALFDDVVRRGVLKQTGKEELSALFTSSMACRSGIANALVAAGANPKAKGENGNALHALLADNDSACAEKNGSHRTDMARTLVALGVPTDGRDSSGKTPLMRCKDPELAQILLKAGANPTPEPAAARHRCWLLTTTVWRSSCCGLAPIRKRETPMKLSDNMRQRRIGPPRSLGLMPTESGDANKGAVKL
jgi:hypothetical protein